MSKFTNRGVPLLSQKEPAASRPIVNIAQPAQILVPLLSPDGGHCDPAVANYETVMSGSVLGIPDEQGQSPVLAPVTGVLSNVRPVNHPLLGDVTCAVIDCMVEGSEPLKEINTDKLTPAELIKAAHKASIVDELDGASLAGKLQEWQSIRGILLVADASEQEPYSSSASAVLRESPVQVRDGLALAARAIGASGYHIAVRLPHKQRQELERKLKPHELYEVRGRYPAPVAHDQSAVPVCRIGVQACLALYRAAAMGEAQTELVLTVAGNALANPQNIRVPIGTMVEDIFRFCGLASNPQYSIFGDVLCGLTISRTDIPVVRGVTCLLAMKNRPHPPAHACVGCGRCVRACHAGLLPFEIMRRLDNMQYERLSALLPEQCDGCGACSYVCPAGLEVTAKVLEARDAHGTIFLKWGDSDDL